MPDEFVGAEAPHGLAVLLDAGDDGNPVDRVVGDTGVLAVVIGGGDGRAIELAEAGAELHQGRIIELLAGEAQYQMLAPRLEDLLERGVAHRLGQVDAVHVGGQCRARRLDPHRAHGVAPLFAAL